jgi:HD superfamily phosphohydrolase YqeK
MTIRRLMERFEDMSALICHPVAEAGRGHPPLIDRFLIDDLLAFTGTGGLRAFLEGYADRSVEVTVADVWIRRDLDTDEELAVVRKDYKRYTIPTPEECDIMLTHYLEVTEAVKAHSRAVAEIAVQLGAVLNKAGEQLDLALIETAGLLHDCFKGVKDHARHGAAWLKEAGFPEVAAIVAEHTDILWAKGNGVDERALVYLTDKIVERERVVTLEERKETALATYGMDSTVRKNIENRFDTAEKIRAAVESIAGRTLDNILRS